VVVVAVERKVPNELPDGWAFWLNVVLASAVNVADPPPLYTAPYTQPPAADGTMASWGRLTEPELAIVPIGDAAWPVTTLTVM
jgi:hypothetical protein